ncbi:ubiquitin-conjugating enzyme/RWD-like protein [Halteromyces radiatus]|uniref:ubiquitin-conjugating enzyme/RWD-like protein n=1 Tax=Halteromyces radiatus TaxID=101107 RepID=UPI00222127CB|nr:ubiquitin-conjugating enzyme/RWD-like protein [Halteromyces radiatus]KAI8097494.1 ubiquitin-conjugating enzyme/RWD-like protein [Halteromyces radiatus]
MSSSAWLSRMKFEITNLENDPPPNVICYPRDDNLAQLEAFLKGPIDTPYEEGLFQLDITVPDKYPFEPPLIRFKTPIYHPNIDEGGRICASILKKGVNEEGWKPAMNLRNTLLSLQQLIGTPNPDDPLDADIAKEYIQDHDLFSKKAKEHTKKYATDSQEKVSFF